MKILIPVDFSKNSEKALQFALKLFPENELDIVLVHVVELVYDFASQAALALDSMHKDAEKLIKNLKAKYQDDRIHIEGKVKEGTPSITLARLAEEEEASLIVMGTKGASGVKKVLVGSTATNLIKESTIPVLLVPEEAKSEGVNRLILALEFADHEENLVDWVYHFSNTWTVKPEILHVQTALGFREQILALGFEQYIQEKFPSQPTKIHLIESSKVNEGIEDFLNQEENIMLVMCHSHHGIWDQLWGKSKSIEMAYHSKVPLLIMV
ncbi:universal stress protein [Algoriphagus hitonicola]|uniref:Nucleotide-binding universal stress protein, UspA family n=1 Tax=Algoriphagus hitonicola TaxID=435880 RepID=A0A1I2XF15_9BACT|nr:universal stress protein [Algoriphagus hitonicola]SFH12080.1 Nucleotide-binding universal stress protein, UspA family [Algoriphagus hitonicola]